MTVDVLKGNCMVFSSASFLLYFLPIFLLLYYLIPRWGKNYILLLASLVFYYVGVQSQVYVMLGVIFLNYLAALLIYRFREKLWLKRTVLVSTLVLSFSVLFYFKYFNFVMESLYAVVGSEWEALNILLPIGISFYLFQTVSYTVDVYRGEVLPRKNPLILATYVTMFPQLVAGPIVRYSEIEAMLDTRTVTLSKAAEGIRRFVFGLGKKVILANTLAELSKTISETPEKTVILYWLWAISFTLTIYFDFSGYSDMAIGLGKLIGFDFAENFRYPYLSKSVTEFFRRWHISLSGWFRDYVYIPLGGNRKGRARQLVNLLIVWLLTGLWHGAAWNFVLWGLLYAVLLMLEKTLAPRIADKIPNAIKHIYLLFFVTIGFVIFDSLSLSDAAVRIGGLFGINTGLVSDYSLYLVRSYAVAIAISIIASTDLVSGVLKKIFLKRGARSVLLWTEPFVLLGILALSYAHVIDSSFNPFIYFRF